MAMERWEYQVVHLNVEPPAPAAPAPPAAAGGDSPPPQPPVRLEAVFSKEYLEKEFPGFYPDPPAAPAPAREHPAHQLRGFLNLQGGQGWQLVGFYPVGQLQMMIFRRPLVGADPVGEEGAAAVPPPPSAAAPGPPSAEAMERILERLAALEARPAAGSPPPSAGVSPLPAAEGDDRSPPGAESILARSRWAELAGRPRLATPDAARALGFRSPASLLNLGARSGYPEGLLKRGANGRLAVYVGCEPTGRGGRERRLWVVLEPPAG